MEKFINIQIYLNSDVIERTNKLTDFCRKEGYKIIFTTHVEKDSKSAFAPNSKNVVCGILTNLCVRKLIEDAYDRDFKITVIKDCCVAFDDETQEFTFKDLKTTRKEIEFLNLDEFIK